MLAFAFPLTVALLAATPQASTFVRALDSESEKAVAVVADARFADHEPGRFSERALARSMTNTGLFTEEDILLLAAPIAQEFGAMTPGEQVRIVSWSSDGSRRTFLFVHGGRMQVVYFRGDVEIDRVRVALATSVEVGVPVVSTPTPISTSTASAPISPAAASPVESPMPVPAKSSRRAMPTEIASADPMTLLTEGQVRKKLVTLDSLRGRGLISTDDWKRKRKEVLNRL